MLQIGLLGTLQVVHDRIHVTPTAPKVRQVLALLAARANTTVPLHQLVEELWEEHPPTSAATTLQTYIYQLRKLPGLCDGQVAGAASDAPALVTTPGGYRLTMPPAGLDICEFDELARRGGREMEDGAVAAAADTLQRALAVWRGPVLSDLTPGPVMSIDALRLTEQRYEVLEDRINADLLLGRHHHLISELAALAADNPTRERLHAKLMLALYRAGRRPEALDAFQRIRTVLASELGLEPCSELQQLHQRVLAGDRALDLPGGEITVRRTPAGVLPVTLPADVALLGRDAELERLGRLLTGHKTAVPRCVTIAGPPGVGTTAFSVHAAHRLHGVFPDGQVYASFGDPAAPRSVDEVLAEILDAIGHPRADLAVHPADRVQQFRSLTAGRRVLIVIDDVASTRQVAGLMPADGGSAVLVVGHRRLYGSRFTGTMDLGPLTSQSALELLCGAIGEERVRADLIGSRILLDLCGKLPGPILEAAGWMVLRPHWSIRQIIGAVARDRTGAVSPHRRHLFRSVLRHCAALKPDLRDVLGHLAGQSGGRLTVETAAGILQRDPDETEELLEELVEFFLLGVNMSCDPSTSRFFQYSLPPIVRTALRVSPARALA